MKGNDSSFVEAARLAKKFFPEAKSFVSPEIGLDWDHFLGAMMAANYRADHSCNPFRSPSDPELGLSLKGGLDGNDSEIYVRLMSHAGLAPSGRVVVVLDAIGTHDWSAEDCLPFICDSAKVPERLREMRCFGQSRNTLFVFESGEALLIDHDDRVHWARSKVNRQWREEREQSHARESAPRPDSIEKPPPPPQ